MSTNFEKCVPFCDKCQNDFSNSVERVFAKDYGVIAKQCNTWEKVEKAFGGRKRFWKCMKNTHACVDTKGRNFPACSEMCDDTCVNGLSYVAVNVAENWSLNGQIFDLCNHYKEFEQEVKVKK